MTRATYFTLVCTFILSVAKTNGQDLVDFSKTPEYFQNAVCAVFLPMSMISEKEMKELKKSWGDFIPMEELSQIEKLEGKRIIGIDVFEHSTTGLKQIVAFEYSKQQYDWRKRGKPYPEGMPKLAYLLVDETKLYDGIMASYTLALQQMLMSSAENDSYNAWNYKNRGLEWLPSEFIVYADSAQLTKTYRRPEMRAKIGAECLRHYQIDKGARWTDDNSNNIIFVERHVENVGKTRIIHTYLVSLRSGIRFFVAEDGTDVDRTQIGRGYLSFLFSETPGNPYDKDIPPTKVVSVPRY